MVERRTTRRIPERDLLLWRGWIRPDAVRAVERGTAGAALYYPRYRSQLAALGSLPEPAARGPDTSDDPLLPEHPRTAVRRRACAPRRQQRLRPRNLRDAARPHGRADVSPRAAQLAGLPVDVPLRPRRRNALDAARRLVRTSGTAGTRVTVWIPQVADYGRYMVSVLDSLGYRARLKVVANENAYFTDTADSRTRAQTGYYRGESTPRHRPTSSRRCSAARRSCRRRPPQLQPFRVLRPLDRRPNGSCDRRPDPGSTRRSRPLAAGRAVTAGASTRGADLAPLDVDFVSERIGNYQHTHRPAYCSTNSGSNNRAVEVNRQRWTERLVVHPPAAVVPGQRQGEVRNTGPGERPWL